MDVDGLEQCRHFGQSFRTADGGAGSEDLSASAVVLPPEHDPVPVSCRFALLKTTALETPASARGCGFGDRNVVHGIRTIASESARIESFLWECRIRWSRDDRTPRPGLERIGEESYRRS